MEYVKDIFKIMSLLIYGLAIFITSCNSQVNIEILMNSEFERYQKGLSEYSVLDTGKVMSHFPQMKIGKTYYWNARYSVPYERINNFDAYYIEQLSINEIKSIISKYSYIDSILYKSASAFKLRSDLINDTTYYLKFYQFDSLQLTHYPIPTFYEVNFKLGESLDYIDSSRKQLSILDTTRMPIIEMTKFNIPDDLMVYIIEAKTGLYFRNTNNLPLRPKIGKWKSGYSRGIAVSKKESMICYWFMIW